MWSWEKYIQDLTLEKHREIAMAFNYEDDPEVRRLGTRWRFDPAFFDIEVARKRISDALASPASVPSGPKTQIVGKMNSEGNRYFSEPKKGNKQVFTPSDGPGDPFGRNSKLSGAFMAETVREKRDTRATALCGKCGMPITSPKTCSRCKKIYYCDKE